MTVSPSYREPPLSPPSGQNREAGLVAREHDIVVREAALTEREGDFDRRERELDRLTEAVEAQRDRLIAIRVEYEERREALTLRAQELERERGEMMAAQSRLAEMTAAAQARLAEASAALHEHAAVPGEAAPASAPPPAVPEAIAEPEPVVVEPEPEPIAVIEPEPEPVAVLPEPEPEPEPVALAEAEPVAAPEPEPVGVRPISHEPGGRLRGRVRELVDDAARLPARSRLDRFSRLYTERDGALAQLGERRLCKPEAAGSNPARSISRKRSPAGLFRSQMPPWTTSVRARCERTCQSLSGGVGWVR